MRGVFTSRLPNVFWLAMAGCLLAGCGSNEPVNLTANSGSAAAGTPAVQLDKVELALNWFPEAEHGGYYAALVHGYYKDAGLDVKIVPGTASSSVLQRVASNRSVFGVENADRILLAKAQDAYAIAVMAPLQKSPRAIMVHAESKFHRIADLADTKLAVNTGSAWMQYVRKKVPLKNVRLVPYSGNVSQFLLDENFAQQAYVFSEPFIAQQKGAHTRCLLVADTGYNPYTSVLVTNPREISERSDVVRRFVSASVHGWQTYLEHPEETNRYIHEMNPELGLDVLEFGAKALRPLCLDGLDGPASLGRMVKKRWDDLAAQMVEAEVLPKGVSYGIMTNDFLPEAKGK
jgi:NitT/TauT family transport system substrate-binding protein